MDPLSVLVEVLHAVCTHCANAKALVSECKSLARLVDDVTPLFTTYCEELAKSRGHGDRAWAKTLHAALEEAAATCLKCKEKPLKVKCFPGKYTRKLKDAAVAIREAMQTLSLSSAAVSAQAKNELDDVLDGVVGLENKIDRSAARLEATADELRDQVKAAVKAQSDEMVAAIAARESVDTSAIAEQADVLRAMDARLDAVLTDNAALRVEIQEAIAAGNQTLLDTIALGHDVYGGGTALRTQFAESLERVEAAVLRAEAAVLDNGKKLDQLLSRKAAHDTKDIYVEELEVVLDSIEPEPFAAGGFGVVHRGSYQGQTVAVKKVPLNGVPMKQRERLVAGFRKELSIMVKLRSPRIVSMYGCVTTDSAYLMLVLEYMPGGSLRDALDELGDPTGPFSADPARTRVLADVAIGMAYLYSHGVEHRDLKPQNVLLDRDGRGVVSDFGLSKSDELKSQSTRGGGGAAGTLPYMAPELLDEDVFTEKSDVYSFGVVTWEVVTRDIPFRGMKEMTVVRQVVDKKKRPPVPSGASPDLVSVMERCWAHDPEARPTFAALARDLGNLAPATPSRGGRAPSLPSFSQDDSLLSEARAQFQAEQAEARAKLAAERAELDALRKIIGKTMPPAAPAVVDAPPTPPLSPLPPGDAVVESGFRSPHNDTAEDGPSSSPALRAIYEASKHDRFAELATLLREDVAVPRLATRVYQPTGWTPFLAAAFYGHEKCLASLIAFSEKNLREGHDPAVDVPSMHPPIAASPPRNLLDVNVPSKKGMTALHLAAQQGNAACVKALVEYAPCEVNACDVTGATPLYMSAEKGKPDCGKRRRRRRRRRPNPPHSPPPSQTLSGRAPQAPQHQCKLRERERGVSFDDLRAAGPRGHRGAHRIPPGLRGRQGQQPGLDPAVHLRLHAADGVRGGAH